MLRVKVMPMSAETATLALGGKWTGRSGSAFCPVHENTRTPALSLADGDNGKLLVKCFAGCDPVDVLRELNRRGLDDESFNDGPKLKPARKISDRRDYALTLWRETQPISDTLAEEYLRKRGVNSPFPASLRFHPSLKHAPSQTRLPAIIALVTTGEHDQATGIHRTYLAPDAQKSSVMPCKMMLGDCGGGAVRLSNGRDGPIVVCEGIETGMSLRDALAGEDPIPRVWAALSTSGIVGIRLPSLRSEVVIAPDGDPPGYRAAGALAARAQAEGHEVRIMAAPPGRDWNDVARDTASEALI